MASTEGYEESQKYFRVVTLLVKVGTSVLQKLFLKHAVSPTTSLTQHLLNNNGKIAGKRNLSQDQKDKMFPPSGAIADINTFDITLLCFLLKDTCTLSPAELTAVDDLRDCRNEIIHSTQTTVSASYKTLWKKVSNIDLHIANLIGDAVFKKEIQDLIQSVSHSTIDQDFMMSSVQVLRSWYDRDQDVITTVQTLAKEGDKTSELRHETLKKEVQKLDEATQGRHEIVVQGQQNLIKTIENREETSQSRHESVICGQQSLTKKVETLDQTSQSRHETVIQGQENLLKKVEGVGEKVQAMDEALMQGQQILQTEVKNAANNSQTTHDILLQGQKLLNKQVILADEESQKRHQVILQSHQSLVDKVQNADMTSRARHEEVVQGQKRVQEVVQDVGKTSRERHQAVVQGQKSLQKVVKHVDVASGERHEEIVEGQERLHGWIKHVDKAAESRHEEMMEIQEASASELQKEIKLGSKRDQRAQKSIKRKLQTVEKEVKKVRRSQKKIEEKLKLIYDQQGERNQECDVDKIYSEHEEKMETELKQIFSSDQETIEIFQRERKRKCSTSQLLQHKVSRLKKTTVRADAGPSQVSGCVVTGTTTGALRKVDGHVTQDTDAGVAVSEGPRRDGKMEKLLSKTRLLLEHHGKRQYVITGQFQEAKKMLDKSGCVVISGKPGEGKTTMAFTLLSDYDPTRCLSISEPQQWSDIDLDAVDILLIDDIFGVFRFDQGRFNSWLHVLETLETIVNSKNLRIVITTRADILAECVDKLRKFSMCSSNKLDLSSSKLSKGEKEAILKFTLDQNSKGLTNEEMDDCLKKFSSKIGFPYTCHLFATNDELFEMKSEFFSKPYSFFIQKLDELDIQKLIALISLFCFGGRKKRIDFKTKTDKKDIKDLLLTIAENVGEEEKTVSNPSKCYDALEQMKGVYVEAESEHFVFAHNLVYESVGIVYGKKAPEHVLEVCNLDFLCQCTQQSIKGKVVSMSDIGKINVPKEFYSVLARRFIAEVLSDRERDTEAVGRIAQHPFLQCTDFVIEFFSTLKSENKENEFFMINNRFVYDQVQRYGFTYPQDQSYFEWGYKHAESFSDFILSGNYETSIECIVEKYCEALKCLHKTKPQASCWKCTQKWIALMTSCRRKSDSVALYLLKMNFPPSVRALRFAMERRHFDVALTVLQRLLPTAAWNMKDRDLETAVVWSYLPDCPKQIHDLLKGAAIELSSHSLEIAVDTKNAAVVQSVIDELKASGKWDPADIVIIISAHHTIVICMKDNLLKVKQAFYQEWVELLPLLIYEAVQPNNLEAVYNKVIELKETGKWNPADKWTAEVIERCIKDDLPEIQQFPLEAGAKVSPLYIDVAVKTGNLAAVRDVVMKLKEAGKWDPADKCIAKAIMMCIKDDLPDIRQFLLEAGAEVLPLHIHVAMETGNLAAVRDVVMKLKETGKWDPADKWIAKAIKRCIKDDLPEIRQFLLEAGAEVLPSYIRLAVKTGNLAAVRDVVMKLKETGKWDPADKCIAEAIIRYIEDDLPDIRQFLLEAGAEVLPSYIRLAVKTGNLAAVRDVVMKLKETGKWDPADQWIAEAIIRCIEDDLPDIRRFLLEAGAEVLPSYIHLAVKTGNLVVVRYVVMRLKETGKWDPTSEEASTALKFTCSLNLPEVRDFLLQMSVPANHYCFYCAVGAAVHGKMFMPKTLQTHYLPFSFRKSIQHVQAPAMTDDIPIIRSIIQNLQEHGTWDPTATEVREAYEMTFQIEEPLIRNFLTDSGIPVTTTCLLAALKSKCTAAVEHAVSLLKNVNQHIQCDRNMEEGHLSAVERPSMPEECLLAAVKTGSLNMVELIIKHLKGSKGMTENCVNAEESVQVAPEVKHTDRTLAGLNMSMEFLVPAVESGNIDLVKYVVQNIQTSNSWDCGSKCVENALKITYDSHNQNIRSFLFSSGAMVTPMCLEYAVEAAEAAEEADLSAYLFPGHCNVEDNSDVIHAVEDTIKRLKESKKWHSREQGLLSALNTTYEIKTPFTCCGIKHNSCRQLHRRNSCMQLHNFYKEFEIQAFTFLKNPLGIMNKVRKVIISSGVEITEPFVLNAVLNKDTETIKYYMMNVCTNPNNYTAKHAIFLAYHLADSEMVELLTSFGVKASYECLLVAVRLDNVSLVKSAVSDLTVETKLNPRNRSVIKAVTEIYRKTAWRYGTFFLMTAGLEPERDKYKIKMLLLDAGAAITSAHLPTVVKFGTLDDVTDIVQNLKDTGRWDPCDKTVITSIELAFRLERFHMAEMFIDSGVEVTPKCLLYAVKHQSVYFTENILQHLQNLNQLNNDNKNIVEVIEMMYKTADRRIMATVIRTCPEIAFLCLITAVQQRNLEYVLEVVEHLKSQQKWNPRNRCVCEAMSMTYKYKNAAARKFLLDVGAEITNACLIGAVEAGDVADVQDVLDHLLRTGTFDRDDKDVVMALEVAYACDEMRPLLLSAGVHITFSCLVAAVRSGRKGLVQFTVDLLRATGQSEEMNCSEIMKIPFVYISRLHKKCSALNRYKVERTEAKANIQEGESLLPGELEIIQDLKLQATVDADTHIGNVIFKRYTEEQIGIAFVLYELDPASANASLVSAMKTGMATVLREVISRLKQLELFSVHDKYTKEALELSYRHRNEEMYSLLISNGAVVDMDCLHAAVCSGNETRVKTVIEELKSSGNWNSDETSRAIEDTFFHKETIWHSCYHKYLDDFKESKQRYFPKGIKDIKDEYINRNIELCDILIEAGAVITPDCLTAAVISRSVQDVKSVISALKLSQTWNPDSKEVRLAKFFSDLLLEKDLELIYPACTFGEFFTFIQSKDISYILTDEGVKDLSEQDRLSLYSFGEDRLDLESSDEDSWDRYSFNEDSWIPIAFDEDSSDTYSFDEDSMEY